MGASAVLDPQIPIIALTAHAMESDCRKCLDAGMNGYLSKPISPQALAGVLSRWLSGEKKIRDNGGETLLNQPVVDKRAPTGREVPAWDRQSFLRRLMEDETLARTIAQDFLEDLPGQIRKMQTLFEARDLSGLAQHAHAIKGAAANVGGMALSAAAAAVETAAEKGRRGSVEPEIKRVARKFEVLRTKMDDFVDGHTNQGEKEKPCAF